MRARLLFVVIGMLAAVGRTAGAAAVGQSDYRLGPGDVIEVSVTPQEKFDRTVSVQPDGKLSYPIVGQIEAAGLTLEQLRETLRAGLSRDLVDPVVAVSLKEASKRAAGRVSVYGAVRTPGSVEIRDGTTLADLLASAGGPTAQADLRRVTITRTDQSVLTLDLSQTEKTGRLATLGFDGSFTRPLPRPTELAQARRALSRCQHSPCPPTRSPS